MTVLHLVKGKGQQVESLTTCFRCGICCTEYQVNLSLAEGQRIADRLEIVWEEFLNGYVDKSWPSIKNFLLRKRNGACIFLERIEGSKVTRCQIHAFRPSSCMDWVPGLYRRECQKGLANYWGLAVNPSGQLEGPIQRVREFYDLLESLAT
ncbi:YkgJ family cysteine cluster protein [Chloroflexota bacterium]